MAILYEQYDAFTGLSPAWRSKVSAFFQLHNAEAGRDIVEDTLDYALKVRPSFGGFIITASDKDKIIAGVLVNKTGMDGFNPPYIFAFANMDTNHPKSKPAMQELIKRTTQKTKGKVGMHLRPDNPVIPVFESMGFKSTYVDLRLRS